MSFSQPTGNTMIHIEPSKTLRFDGPFTKPSNTTLTLTNPHDEIVLFKIKTTAPKLYCVRPSRGMLRSHEVKTIHISIQTYEQDKHKFLILWLLAPKGEYNDFNEIWQKATETGEPFKSKLKCEFVQPQQMSALPIVKDEGLKKEPTVPIAQLDYSKKETEPPSATTIATKSQLTVAPNAEECSVKASIESVQCESQQPPVFPLSHNSMHSDIKFAVAVINHNVADVKHADAAVKCADLSSSIKQSGLVISKSQSESSSKHIKTEIEKLVWENDYLERENTLLQEYIAKLNAMKKSNGSEDFNSLYFLVAVAAAVLGYIVGKYMI